MWLRNGAGSKRVTSATGERRARSPARSPSAPAPQAVRGPIPVMTTLRRLADTAPLLGERPGLTLRMDSPPREFGAKVHGPPPPGSPRLPRSGAPGKGAGRSDEAIGDPAGALPGLHARRGGPVPGDPPEPR